MLAEVAIFLLTIMNTAESNLFMVVQYDTNGQVILNQANVSIKTLEIHVTLLGCDYGYYDYYLLYPPKVKTPQMEITPFECLECVCDWNNVPERTEQFIASNV